MVTSNLLHPQALIRRFGALAFAFFLLKGFLWLLAPFVFLWFA